MIFNAQKETETLRDRERGERGETQRDTDRQRDTERG